VFLALIVVDAVATAAIPLLYRAIIDRGITAGRTGLVVALAGVVAALAVVSAGLGLAQRAATPVGPTTTSSSSSMCRGCPAADAGKS
jgi:hypothetical protein